MRTSSIPGYSRLTLLFAFALAAALPAKAAHQYVYLTNNFFAASVSVVDADPLSATFDTVVGTIPTHNTPFGIAVSPDNTRLYVTDGQFGAGTTNTIEVITLSFTPPNVSGTVTATITLPASGSPNLIAFTPDGKHAYVADSGTNQVSVIDTNPKDGILYNTEIASPGVGSGPWNVAVTPVQKPAAFPFAAFATKLSTSSSGFRLNGSFTLGAGSPGIDLSTQDLTLTLDSFSMTIPAKSFQSVSVHHFLVFSGTIDASYQNAIVPISVTARIVNVGGGTFTIQMTGAGIDLSGLPTPVTVGLTIGPNTGTDSPSSGHTGGNNSWH